MPLPDARYLVCQQLHGRHRTCTRYGHPGLHLWRGATDEHHPVLQAGGRHLARQHLVKGYRHKSACSLAGHIVRRTQYCLVVGWNGQAPDTHGAVLQPLHIAHSQVQAVCGGQQCQCGHARTVLAQHQRYATHHAIGIRQPLHVPHACCGLAQTHNRGPHPFGRKGIAPGVSQGTAMDEGWPLFCDGVARHSPNDAAGQQHSTGPLDAGGQPLVGVECRIRFIQRAPDQAAQCCRLRRCRAQHGPDLPQIGLARIVLRMVEWCGVNNGLGPCGRQAVDDLGMHIARPGPRADLRQAGVVDGHDDDFAQGLAVCACNRRVVDAPIEALHHVRGEIQRSHGQNQQQGSYPVLAHCLPHLNDSPHVHVPFCWINQ